ncbi:MAG: DUF4258 domain-containing protein [Deltaproteobacteria bacterium]|nr:DUF4258 domain-containing protein [Deltaproteobacteria bacterium]
MGISISNFCKQSLESVQQFAKSLPLALPFTKPSPVCEEIQNQLHLKTLEEGEAYIQTRLKKSQEEGSQEAPFTQKVANWFKGYGYLDDGAVKSETAEFKKIVGCLDHKTLSRLVPKMALDCEMTGMRSGALCWTNTKGVAESAILAGSPLLTKQTVSGVASTSEVGIKAISDHAAKRMLERGISEKFIEEVIEKGVKQAGNEAGVVIYDLPSHLSSTGKGARIVINEVTGKVITVINKGSKYLRGK